MWACQVEVCGVSTAMRGDRIGGNGVDGITCTDEVDKITVDWSSEVDSISSELEVGLVGTPGP